MWPWMVSSRVRWGPRRPFRPRHPHQTWTPQADTQRASAVAVVLDVAGDADHAGRHAQDATILTWVGEARLPITLIALE